MGIASGPLMKGDGNLGAQMWAGNGFKSQLYLTAALETICMTRCCTDSRVQMGAEIEPGSGLPSFVP